MAAGEADSLLKQMLASLNTRVGHRYVLGGTLDGQPPFDAAGAYRLTGLASGSVTLTAAAAGFAAEDTSVEDLAEHRRRREQDGPPAADVLAPVLAHRADGAHLPARRAERVQLHPHAPVERQREVLGQVQDPTRRGHGTPRR